jgi:triosephosphate isomerase
MLAKLNVSYVIVGHSERRQHFGETDELVNRKVKGVLKAGMTPILCVGETLPEREAGLATTKVLGQLEAALSGRPGRVVGDLVIAYEPIWAIGTGRVASTGDAQEMTSGIRRAVATLAGAEAAASVRLQYGGSVTGDNAAAMLACRDVDGLLVGGASLDAVGFSAIVRAGA